MSVILGLFGFFSIIIILILTGIYCEDPGNMDNKYYVPVCGFITITGLLIIMVLVVYFFCCLV